MDELKKLVKIILERSNKSFPLISQQDSSSLETKFFNLIKQDKVHNDEEAIALLYTDKSFSASYRMLKSRLRKKLFNHLHYIEFPESKYSSASIESYKLHAMLLEAQALITANEFKMADKLLTQAIAVAKAHHITPCVVNALEKKLLIHTTIINRKLYQEYTDQLLAYYELEAQERQAAMLFQKATVELGTSVIIRKKYLPLVPDVVIKLSNLWANSKSPFIYNYYHILKIHYLELQGNYHAISDAVAQGEQLLEEGVIHESWFNYKYNAFIRVYALLRTGQYEEGLKHAEAYLRLFDESSVNWFAFLENYLLLALYAQRYNLAGELLQKSINNSSIEETRLAAKERWELYRRYLLLLTDVLPVQLQVELPQDIFIELVSLPKDKAGFNLSLLVLDIIQSFQLRHFDDYEQQAERIRKYILKYMRGEKAERPRLFLRLLLLAIKHELDFTSTSEASKSLYAKLRQASPPGDAFAEVEIVPYEHLWETVLLVLRSRER